jgi:hypothetical protein
MSTNGSDYIAYEVAKAQEGGLYPGRRAPSRGLLLTAVASLAILIGGMIAIGLLLK